MTDPQLAQAPTWRRQPYRVFFPLGFALAWAGVLHWALFAFGALPDYRPDFHATVQIQGFLMCFAVGFLFTMIPRRTGTDAPAVWEMVVGIAAPVGMALAAWLREWALAQWCWIALLATLIAFAVRRARGAGRRPPDSFVWLPLAFLMGLAGSLTTIVDGAVTDRLGRLLLFQGMFLGLVVGVGGMLLPLITRGQSSRDGIPDTRGARIAHLVCAVLLVATFVVEVRISRAAGYALRGGLCLALLLAVARIYRLPDQPGWHRWLIWASAWMIPLGYLTAAMWPEQYQAGLHIVFLGGFATMALSVGMHVSLAHGGSEDLVRGRPWQVPVFGALLWASLLFRVLAQFEPARLVIWLGVSATTFLCATLFWAALVLPRTVRGAA